jgi:outer membrane protein assembly factor BamB
VIVPFARGGDDGGGVFSYALASGTVTTSNDPDLGHAQAPAVRGSLIATIVGQQDGEAGAVGVQYGSRRGLAHCCIGVPPFTAPTLHGDRAFAGVSQHVDAFDLATCTPSGIRDFCKPAWTAALGSTTTMAVAVSPSEIAVGLANGQLKVLDVASGAVKWTGTTGSSGAQAPAVAGNRIYVGTADGRVRAFARAGCGAATCSALWHTTTGDPIAQQPAVANGLVYVGTATGQVKAFDAAGCPTSPCPPLWDGDTETFSPVSGGPVIAGGHVYVATLHGQLIAFGLPK